jgi:ribonuclease J
MTVPSGVLIDISDVKRYRPEELTIVTTGSQGEPMSALYRMAFSDHSQITLGQSDLVVLSASAIPGNEKLVGRVINELTRTGIKVMHESAVAVHVSGHACGEELKLMQALTKPRYFMPIHGEYRHLMAHRDIALYMGMDGKNIFVSDIGRVLEIDPKGARFTQEEIPAGRVLVDGYGVGDVGNIVLRDRLHLAQDGLIVVVATISENGGGLLSGPDIVSRGFVYVREAESLMDETRMIAAAAISEGLKGKGGYIDRMALKKRIKDDVTKFLYGKTGRKPMILPVIMDV